MGTSPARERRRSNESVNRVLVVIPKSNAEGYILGILDMFKLDGKTALVTGARRGIGKAMAIALAEAGADIIAVSASLEGEGSDIEKEVRSRGRKYRGYSCDFSDRKAVYAFLEAVRASGTPIDIL